MFKIVPIKGKGRGLVATCYIHAGEEISKGPILSFPLGSTDALPPLFNLVWWRGDMEHLTLAPHTLCNHSFDPNCECEIEDDMDILKAKRDICEGEELTLDYREFDK